MQANLGAYVSQAIALLPRGVAWARQAGSTLVKLLTAQAAEMLRVHERALRLIEEADPATTVELLADWERVCQLPSRCSTNPPTDIAGRQQQLLTHLTMERGQSRAYFIGLAAQAGHTVAIVETRPPVCGRARCGDQTVRLGPHEVRHMWRMTGLTTDAVGHARAGRARCGTTPLGYFARATEVECRVRRASPAHTQVFFGYRVVTLPLLLAELPQLVLSDGVTPLLFGDGVTPLLVATPAPGQAGTQLLLSDGATPLLSSAPNEMEM